MLRLTCSLSPTVGTASSARSVTVSLHALGCCSPRRLFSTSTRRLVSMRLQLPNGATQGRSAGGFTSHSYTFPATTTALLNAKRSFRARAKDGANEAKTPEGEPNQSQSAASSKTKDDKTKAERAGSATGEGGSAASGGAGGSSGGGSGGWRAHVEAIKRDVVEFPDIYNSANAINFVLFTVFCLCSTGSSVEADWWLDQFGIDASFRPLAWLFHSLVMNNFLSMTFAMMLLHTMCHSVLPTIGSRGLFQYCAIVSVAAGFLMWAGSFALGYHKEKQFGPWDIVSALFVMQFAQQGFTPWQILNSFNGWVRYACWVGTACILYYDWQPTVVGGLLGVALCKGHPKFRAPIAGGTK